MLVFDRAMKHTQRNVAATRPDSHDYDYLRDQVALYLVDRLSDIKRKFPVAADIGCNTGNIGKYLSQEGGIETLIQIDSSEKMLYRDVHKPQGWGTDNPANIKREIKRIHADEENLPLEENSINLAMSSLSMHWLNDLPGMMKQICKALKPDGCFIGAMLGGNTLQELRSAFAVADMERKGGVSPHVSPFTRPSDIGELLTQAGFALPTVDTDTLVVKYPDMFTLIDHLSGMGETSVSLSRAPYLSRDVALAAAAAYQGMYADEQGLIPCTFQVLYMIGWSPHTSQPQPLERGTGQVKIEDALRTNV